MVGRYRLLRKLGEGGAGVVYEAEQEVPVRRRVALKCIKPGMDTRSVIQRFEAERQALAMMDHPGIATVFDAGATTTGRPYFVMELVNGLRITQFCDQHRLTIPERLQLFIQICQAVQHAHHQGIVHRDLKPSNILVTSRHDHPAEGCPKIIDFGIAKATRAQLTEATLLTEQGQFIGTPAYMSPEQMLGGELTVDARSDIYSLGVLLYELLTGELPLTPGPLVGAEVEKFRRIVCETDPLPPSVRLRQRASGLAASVAEVRSTDPAGLGSRIAGDLDWIVMKCLEKDRERRYQTVHELAGEILRHLGDQPVLARPPSTAYVVRKFARRHRTVFFGLLAACGVLVAATAVSLGFAFRARNAESLAARRLSESETSRDESVAARKDAELLARYLIEVFRSPDPGRDGRTITVAEALGAAAAKLEGGFAKDSDQKAKLQLALGETYHGLGIYPEALAMLESSRRHYESRWGVSHPDTLQAARLEARTLEKLGRATGAIALLERSLAPSPRIANSDRISQFHSMVALAKTYRNLGKLGESVDEYRKALALCTELLGSDHPDTCTTLSELAGSPGISREERRELYEALWDRSQRVLGRDHRLAIHAGLGLATAYWGARRSQEAAELFREVLRRSEKNLGLDDAVSLKVRARFRAFGLAEYRLDELDELYSTDLERAKATGNRSKASLENSLLNLAWLRSAQQRFPESEVLHREAEASLRLDGSDPPSLAFYSEQLFLGALHARWAWAEGATDPIAGLAKARLGISILRTNLNLALGDSRVTERRAASMKSQLGNATAVMAILDPLLPAASRKELLNEADALLHQADQVLFLVRKDQPTNYRECLMAQIRLQEYLGRTNLIAELNNRVAQLSKEPFDYEVFD